MEIIKVNIREPDLDTLKKVSADIERGKLVAYPTDTLYGLCTNPFDEDAVRRLLSAKKRGVGKGLPILVDGLGCLKKIAYVDERVSTIVERFWPGALTLILNKRIYLSDTVTGSDKTVAVRMPACTLTLKLAGLCGGFIIGTSANISGSIDPPTTAERVVEELYGLVDIVLDGGKTPWSQPSTIIDVSGVKVRVAREGALPLNELRKFLGSIEANF